MISQIYLYILQLTDTVSLEQDDALKSIHVIIVRRVHVLAGCAKLSYPISLSGCTERLSVIYRELHVGCP
jgi:hypothetical protein